MLGEPDLPNVEIASRVQAVAEPCGAWRRGLKYEIEENGLLATVVFSGTYPADCGEKTWPLSVFDARPLLRVRLPLDLERGRRHARAARCAPGARRPRRELFHRYESEPLADARARHQQVLQQRDGAPALPRALAEKGACRARRPRASAWWREWLAAKGIEAPELAIENGSGLSRTDRASAATLAAVLRSAWASPRDAGARGLAAGVRRGRHLQDAGPAPPPARRT